MRGLLLGGFLGNLICFKQLISNFILVANTICTTFLSITATWKIIFCSQVWYFVWFCWWDSDVEFILKEFVNEKKLKYFSFLDGSTTLKGVMITEIPDKILINNIAANTLEYIFLLEYPVLCPKIIDCFSLWHLLLMKEVRYFIKFQLNNLFIT